MSFLDSDRQVTLCGRRREPRFVPFGAFSPGSGGNLVESVPRICVGGFLRVRLGAFGSVVVRRRIIQVLLKNVYYNYLV